MKKISVLIIALSALMLLSSCSSINEIDERKVKDVSDKITEVIIDSVGKESAEKKESFNIAAENLNTLNIESTVGDIDITTHESTEATIQLKVIAKSNSKENAEKLIEEFDYKIEENSNSINIDTTFEDDNLFDNSNIQTELTISLPKNINSFIISLNVGEVHVVNSEGSFKIESNVGNISVESSKGTYQLSTDVGDIVVLNSTAEGDCDFHTNTGNIELSLGDISNANIISALTNVGDVELKIPESSDYEATVKEFMKDERTESNGSKKTKIELESNVGEISFN